MCTRFRALSATETARARGSSHRARARPRPVASGVQSGAHSAAGWRTTSTMTCRIVEQVVLILRRAGAAVHEPGREALHAARPAAGAGAATARRDGQHASPPGDAAKLLLVCGCCLFSVAAPAVAAPAPAPVCVDGQHASPPAAKFLLLCGR